ncbi:unnamed protein product [Rhizoctonia solani]|uniref:Protein kinase domain-containing protein n=1 Tax=Rhizoctonia solani TaxID=456999 RepID=A0A8H3BQI7_9AGAM|nr:unnamed protein product [Rhizoctonia solani]
MDIDAIESLSSHSPPRSPLPADAPAPSSPEVRPLNVKDALSYLEMVKVKFQDKPDVYNHFLDIMKDFKSQAIDTPGVIDRVSSLFNGHTALIQGFNTFLPQGYRIDCTVDEHGHSLITVTTPSGTTTQTTGGPPSALASASIIHPDLALTQKNAPPKVEFNQAVNYVNKIKQRFASDPDTYKQFLEILQTYQKEQQPIAEVYQKVNVLFDHHRDLLEDLQHFLPDHGENDGGAPRRVAEGGFGDVWRGRLTDGTSVAIKVLRYSLVRSDESKDIKRAMREIYNWSKLEHKHVHKLLGVTMFQERLGMVSVWMEHGTLKQYLDQHTNIDRHKLCFQIAEGVTYLHSVDMVHGDLKASNILVSSDGTLKLTDFDYSIISDCSVVFSATTRGGGGTLRWMAPELLISENPVERSKFTDIYALGMTFLETVTNALPYSECQRDAQIYRKLHLEEYPKRSMTHFPDNRLGNSMWEILIKCWDYNPSSRPTAGQILVTLETEINLTN